MATITTIAAGDLISGSRTDINTNFSNLNSDKIETSTLDTDGTLAANSDSKLATQKAVKTYADAVASPTGKSWNEYAVDAAGTDSYVVTVTGITSLVAGQTFKFKSGTANTGACTLNVNGLGAKTIKKDVSTDLVTGDILANQIVIVTYDGTNMQLVSVLAGARDVSLATGILPVANGGTGSATAPISVFQQLLPTTMTTNGLTTGMASGSNQDGSVLFVYEDDSVFKRYIRDTNTGMYYVTHTINPSMTLSGLPNSGLVVIGNYVYLIYDNGTDVGSTRFLAADLSDETTMTVPTVTASGTLGIVAWTDGTYLYFILHNATTTVIKWSLSGTICSAVTTGTAYNDALNGSGNWYTSFYDGTNIYVVKFIGTQYNIFKLTEAMYSSAATTSSILLPAIPYGNVKGGIIATNISSNKMYLGHLFGIFNESAQYTVHQIMSPYTKP